MAGILRIRKVPPDVVLGRCTKIRIKRKYFAARGSEETEDTKCVGGNVFAGASRTCPRNENGRHERGALQEENLIFLGLVGMKDPIRPEAKEAVAKFKKASVQTVMITGDHAKTALAIAQELGIARKAKECMTGEELENLTDIELGNRLKEVRVFARVSPEHKVRIVRVLKKTGERCGDDRRRRQ